LGSLTKFISDSINNEALDIENKVESNQILDEIKNISP
jgi:hypothetical protein